MLRGLRMWHVWALIVPIYAATGLFILQRLVWPAAPLNFDEAAHSLPAFYILRDVLALDFGAFWGDFHIQTLWPPGFSLLLAPFLGVLGRSDAAARMFAFAMIGGCILVSWSIIRETLMPELSGHRVVTRPAPALAPLAMLFVAVLHLTSPGWLFVGSWAMQETPVAFVQLTVFWIFFVAMRTQKKRFFVLTSFGLFCLFITKYNYAAFALAALGWAQLGRAWVERRQGGHHLVRMSLLLAPLAALVAGWFFTGTEVTSTATKWRDFAFFVTNENSGYDTLGAENLLYYVRASADWVMVHPVAFGLCILAAGWAILRVRHIGVRALGLYFVIGFVLASLHPLKASRYITPLFPSLWLMAALGLAQLAVSRRHDWLALALAAAFGLFAWFFSIQHLQPVWAGSPARDLRWVADSINQWQQYDRPVLVIGTFGELGPPYFEWRLRPRPEFAQQPDIQYDAPPGEGDDLARVHAWLKAHPTAQVTLLRVGAASPFYGSDDMQKKNLWKQKLAIAFAQQPNGYILREERALPDSDLHVSYWLPK